MKLHTLTLGLSLSLLATAALAKSEERKGYLVELRDAPAAAYTGGVSGLAATQPARGNKLNIDASHVQQYIRYLDGKQTAMSTAVPAAQIYHRYKVVVNGFAAMLTQAELKQLAADPGVASITADEMRQLDTSYTPTFLGINQAPNGIWTKTDAQGRIIKGEGVIVAHIDGGVWPENASFSDRTDASGYPVPFGTAGGTVAYSAPPASKWRGTCQDGEGFIAAQHCNNKLIGARYFNNTWKQLATPTWSLEYLDSPRDSDGHGTHTLSTAGGAEGAMSTAGVRISGMAPRAWVASYKVCYNGPNGPGVPGSGCYNGDSVAAIDQAVADGADVINFSISGSRTSIRDLVETAFLRAALAGVFVSASAGNANTNGAPTVAHNSPWLMTVGNSTHDRFIASTVTLGNGANYTGAARFSGDGLSTKLLVLSSEAGLPGANATAVNLCYSTSWNDPAKPAGTPALDPAKVAGKIVVCDRGVSDRVDKSRAVAEAGGAGMILINTNNNSLNNDRHSVPTVHLQFTDRTAVRTYAAGGAGMAEFSVGAQATNVVAPIMNATSSLGPNGADFDVLKPDITAPGTDILAGVSARLGQAARNAVIANPLSPIPPQEHELYSGTSMSSPHIAGLAALLRQANPTWSPWAIKSALLTSAVQTVKVANGAANTNRFAYGSGHVNPNSALATTVVFDTTNQNYIDHYNNVLSGRALNLSSLTAGGMIGVVTFNRSLTNKGTASETYSSAASAAGFNVAVSPTSLTLAPGETKSFSVTATRTSAAFGQYVFGEVVWTGPGGKTVRSPLTLRPQGLATLPTLTDTRLIGTKILTVGVGFSGQMSTTPNGLQAAERLSGALAGTPAANEETCFPLTVAAGNKLVRLQMFNSEVEGGASSDFDVELRTAGGAVIGGSYSGTSEELVQVAGVAAGAYQACAIAYAPVNGGTTPTNYAFNAWVLGSGTATGTPLKAFGPSNVAAGSTPSVGMSWNVPAGNRYLGLVEYRNPPSTAVLASTLVLIDTSAAAPAGAAAPKTYAPVHRDKLVEFRLR